VRLRALLDPAILPAYAASGSRMARRAIRGHARHRGDAIAILRAVVDSCRDGRHLDASGGHFRQFWTRDFGFSAPALVRLGEGAAVDASLEWALGTWSGRGLVTTTIFPGRRPADVWDYGVDSLPLLVRALRAAPSGELLVARSAALLAAEVRRFGEAVVEPAGGWVRDDRPFSTHRDTVRTGANAYAHAMVALLELDLRETGWFPLPFPAGAADRLVAAFWRGDHFAEGRAGTPEGTTVTGDANVIPFWLGVVPDDLGARPMLARLEEEGLARPIPLRYAARRSRREDRLQGALLPDYQGTAIWTSLGVMTLDVMDRVGAPGTTPALERYAALVERDGTLWEVLDDDLRPYRGRFGLWRADEAMLWAAILLELLERRAVRAAP
jgi:hypothetical protein